MKVETVTRQQFNTWDETTIILTPEETEVLEAILKSNFMSGQDVKIAKLGLTTDTGCTFQVNVSRAERKDGH